MEPHEICARDGGGGGGGNNGKSGDGFIDRSKVRILLCDNDTKSSQEVLRLLCKCSYQVTSVRSARQVIDALNAEGPYIDIILSEVDLPIAKGLKMLKYIMRDKELQRIPVIMMSPQDEVSVVVKCLRLGAADYLVKPLRTNELLNLWTHMWRRRQMLGLAEKNILSYDFDLAASDPSDANTNSTTLFSDDTDDKSRKSANPEISITTQQQDEANAAPAATMVEHPFAPLEYRYDVPEISVWRMGQFSSCPTKSKLKIGESSAFFTYVKSSVVAKGKAEDVVSVDETAPQQHTIVDKRLDQVAHHVVNDSHVQEIRRPMEKNHWQGDEFPSQNHTRGDEFPSQNNARGDEFPSQNNARGDEFPSQNNDRGDKFPSQHNEFPSQINARGDEFPSQNNARGYEFPSQNNARDSFSQERSSLTTSHVPQEQHSLDRRNSKKEEFPGYHPGFHGHTAYPYYIPGMMNQVMMSSPSAQMYQKNMQNLQNCATSAMLPQYNYHMPGMAPFPYYPVNVCLQPGQMPPTQQPWPSPYGNPSSNVGKVVDRREAALLKFRQKRKERCFDKKIRYVNRKRLAEKRPRVRGQFVRKVNGVKVDLNGQPTSGDFDDDEEEEDEDRDSSPENDTSVGHHHR